MEKEGLNRCINFLKDSKLEVDVLVTDRHKQINKWLQEAHPKIKHYYDIWHVAKGTVAMQLASCTLYSCLINSFISKIPLTGFRKKLEKLGK